MEQGISESRLRSTTWSLSNISLKYRLPILIGTLLAGVIIGCNWASYRAVKASALEVGRERLQNLTQQLSTLLQQSVNNISTKTVTAANDAAVRAFLKSPETASRPDVEKLLQQFTAPQDVNSIRVELWSVDRGLLLVWPEADKTPLGDLTTDFKQASVEPFKTIGPIRPVKDTVGFAAVAAIKKDDGKVAGYLVRWRKLTATADTRQQLTKLLGTSATLYLGNNNDDVWTDFVNIAGKPSVDVRTKQDIATYMRDGNTEVIGLARPIAGTPWLILIEFPTDVVLKPVSGYVKRMVVIGLFLFVMGVAGTFVLSRNITGPLY